MRQNSFEGNFLRGAENRAVGKERNAVAIRFRLRFFRAQVVKRGNGNGVFLRRSRAVCGGNFVFDENDRIAVFFQTGNDGFAEFVGLNGGHGNALAAPARFIPRGNDGSGDRFARECVNDADGKRAVAANERGVVVPVAAFRDDGDVGNPNGKHT